MIRIRLLLGHPAPAAPCHALIVALIALLMAPPVMAKCYRCEHRSSAARREFKREHPCPSTGRSTGHCRDWIIDHVVPLCAGGADAPTNMQWQTRADAKAKDRIERKECGR